MPNLCDRSLCTGCLACLNACSKKAISIAIDKEGFWQPSIDSTKCVNCGLCEKICPAQNKSYLNFKEPLKTQIAWSKDSKLLFGSSSGGVFSLFAEQIIKENGFVYGARFDSGFNVYHDNISSLNELHVLRGSKYVQSFIGESFSTVKKQLENGDKVLFTGTPCQIAGLLSFLRGKNYENLFTVDIVCHGVPSPKIFHSYIEFLEKKFNGKIVDYCFRQKKWSWFSFNTYAKFSNGKAYSGKWEEDTFMRGFLREFFLRPSCHNCPYSQRKRISDITLCDYWGYKKQKQEEDNNDKGVSSIIINTEKGSLLFSSIEARTIHYARDYEQFVKCQQALRKCFPQSPIRDKFWEEYNKKGYEATSKTFLYPEKIGKRKRIKYVLESFAIYKAIRKYVPIIRKL